MKKLITLILALSANISACGQLDANALKTASETKATADQPKTAPTTDKAPSVAKKAPKLAAATATASATCSASSSSSGDTSPTDPATTVSPAKLTHDWRFSDKLVNLATASAQVPDGYRLPSRGEILAAYDLGEIASFSGTVWTSTVVPGGTPGYAYTFNVSSAAIFNADGEQYYPVLYVADVAK